MKTLPRLMLALLLIQFVPLKLFAVEIPPNPKKSKPGMELGPWILETWGNPGVADRIAWGETKILALTCDGGDKDKTAFKHVTGFGVGAGGKISLDVFVPGNNPPAFSVVMSTAAAYAWHETKLAALKTGWNHLEFEADAPEWKTEASGWKNSVALKDATDVRAVDLIVMNGKENMQVYVSGMRFDPDDKGKKAAEFAVDMRSEDAERREIGEKGLVALGRTALETLHQLTTDDRPEVLLRAASAIKAIEGAKEDAPTDPTIIVALEKQREEQGFDEARRRADYILRSIQSERLRLLGLLTDADNELKTGRDMQKSLKHTPEEKTKIYADTLDSLEKIRGETENLGGFRKAQEEEKANAAAAKAKK